MLVLSKECYLLPYLNIVFKIKYCVTSVLHPQMESERVSQFTMIFAPNSLTYVGSISQNMNPPVLNLIIIGLVITHIET